MKPISYLLPVLVVSSLLNSGCAAVAETAGKAKESVTNMTTKKASRPVGITGTMSEATVKHNGEDVVISRDQDNSATVSSSFAKTSRPCPPFCIQPIVLAPGVETIGEQEIIHYLTQKSAGDDSILVIDSRTKDWVARGTIPGAVNLPWTLMNPKRGATTAGIMNVMSEHFNVKTAADADEFDVDEAIAEGDTSSVFDFSNARTLVMFCNGMWCGQSPNNIMNLLKFGYPAEKIKWYRGGMQSWSILGFNTVKP